MAKLRVDKIAAPIVKDEFTGSVFFDGTGDNLTLAASTDFAYGTYDFTWEMWVYPTDLSGNHYIIDHDNNGGVLALGQPGNRYYNTTTGSSSVLYTTGFGSLSANTWYHLAAVREDGTTSLYTNGVLISSASDSHNYGAQEVTIGNYGGDSQEFKGYISNLRICKGHAVYTGNFTPPTRELEVHTGAKGVVFPAADNRTVLLACQSSTDATAEATGRHILTANGNATAADANPGLFRKTNITSTITENTGSVFFDGTGDYLKIDSSSDFAFGTGNFTMECFYYPTGGNYEWLMDCRDATTSQLGPAVYTNGSNISVYINGSVRISGTRPSDNNWYHVALVRNSGTTTLYVDGISQGTYSDSTNYVSTNFRIGGNEQNPPTLFGTQYSSNVRVCKGHAVYKSQFIPPTRELDVHPGPDDDRTVLLCCHDGENIFADKSGRHIIAAYGDRTSSPTPTATDSPIGSTTVTPGLTRSVDATAGPTFQGGVGFTSQNWLTLPKGTTAERYAGSNSASPAPRGLRGSGQVAPNNAITNTVDSVEIATTGDALDFGDLITSKFGAGGIGSPTRGLFCGGGTPTRQTAIDYFTISTRGNGQDFGDIFGDARTLAGATGGNETRGLTFGGATSSGTSNVICAITISSTGSVSDFGDCTKQNGTAVVCSPTRAVAAGGDSAANGSHINTIDYVTIQTFGNSFDFGDLAAAGSGRGVSSATRGLFSTGAPSATNTINYVTIATTSNSVDFGDLISNNISGGCASYSSLTRGCFAGLRTPTVTNTIEYFTISTLGDALNFGDLTQSVSNGGGLSNGHGGLG